MIIKLFENFLDKWEGKLFREMTGGRMVKY